MKKTDKSNAFGGPEELEELQLTEEEIGMLSAGLNIRKANLCPWCEQYFDGTAALSHHRAICPKRPLP